MHILVASDLRGESGEVLALTSSALLDEWLADGLLAWVERQPEGEELDDAICAELLTLAGRDLHWDPTPGERDR